MIHPDVRSVVNSKTISATYLLLGQKYLDDNKQEFTEELRTLTEVTFLGRHFRHDKDREWIAPLSEQTLKDQVMWVREKPDMVAALRENLESAVVEAALHPPAWYKYFCGELKKAIVKLPQRPYVPMLSHKQMRKKYFAKVDW